ncbi:MAG: TonB-dependent receptor, partial [Nevskiaceae bacterium]|nr:TonB-dependent receptor [Nevskiaceae bacterium]
ALDFFNASGRVSGGRESQQDQPGYDWLVSARVGTLRPLLNLVDPDVGQPGYTDGYARAGWGDPDGLRITANLLVSRDELAIAREPRAEQGDIENRARYLWLRADDTWGPNLRASLMLGQTRMESFREGASNEPLIALGEVQDRRASRATDLRGNVVWQWRANHLLEAGFELKDEDARYRYAATAVFAPQVAALFNRDAQLQRDIELNPTRQRGAFFASWRWRMSDSITTEVGGRAQRLLTRGQGTEWISEPRLGLSWQALPDTRLQLAWGRFTQIDEIDELAIEDGVQQLAAPQRSEHLIAGIEQRLTPEVGLRLEVFRKLQTSPRTRYENLLDTQSLFPEIAPDRVAISLDRAELSGVELSANYDATALHVWGTLGWSRSQDRIIAGMWAPRSWDQRWMASGGAMWTQGRWLFSGQLDVHEGWPRTHLFRDTQGDLQLGPRNGNRLETFAQLNLRAQYTRPMALGELTFVAQLMNATNWRNECCTELVIVDGELTGRPLHWLPIIPSLGLRWSF